MASALPDVTGVTSPSTDDASSEQNDETKSEEDNKKPELVWEQEDVTLDYIGDEDRLPCVCQFENVQGEGTAQLSQGLRVYSKQPVLMYTRTTKLQAHVRSIHKDSTGAYYEIGQTLIIPYDYPGKYVGYLLDKMHFQSFDAMDIAEEGRVEGARTGGGG